MDLLQHHPSGVRDVLGGAQDRRRRAVHPSLEARSGGRGLQAVRPAIGRQGRVPDVSGDPRSDIALVYREIGRRGLITGSSGNVSHRTADGMLITPSGCLADSLRPDDIVAMSLDGDVRATLTPSSEWVMHAAIY